MASDGSILAEDEPEFVTGAIVLGREIGPYVVRGVIARGGNGVVLRATDPRLGRGVAIKLIDDLDSDMLEDHLVGEARALAKMSHPNIVPVFDLGLTADGRVWVAMELVEGNTIDEWAKTQSKEAVCSAWIDVAKAIAHAHNAGVLHRDIKPGNVMVDEHGRVRVLDFGLARDFSTANIRVGKISRKFFGTKSGGPSTGEVVGTMDYMAPELFRGASVSTASDQFSYAVAMYRALFDRDPFDGAARGAWVKVAPSPPVALGKKAPFSARVEQVLLRALDPEPRNRWPSMAALVEALSESVREPLMDPFERVRARVQLGAVMIALAIVLLSVERLAVGLTPRGLLLGSLVVSAVVSLLSYRWREQLFRTPFSKMLTTLANLVAVASLVHRAINAIDSVAPSVTLRGDAVMVAAGAAYIAIFHDPLFFVAVASSTLAALGCALAPSFAGLFFGASQAVAIVLFAFRAVRSKR